eukprot:SM000092S24491  [mRNA]  locus=s92:234243:240763:- [translate_table: standard]
MGLSAGRLAVALTPEIAFGNAASAMARRRISHAAVSGVGDGRQAEPGRDAGDATSTLPLVEAGTVDGKLASDAPTMAVSKQELATAGSGDMMKLFNDAQQSEQTPLIKRLVAVEELQRADRDRKLLLARIGQLEAETAANAAQKELLQQRLRHLETSLGIAESRGGALFRSGLARSWKHKPDPPPIWSSLLLRVDSLLLTGALAGHQADGLRQLARVRDVQVAETYAELVDCEDYQLAAGLISLLDHNKRRGLHVVQVATELAPIAQAGSLGKFVTGLSRALRKKGHLVEVIVPKYGNLDMTFLEGAQQISQEIYSYFAGEWVKNRLWTGTVYGLPVTLIEPVHERGFFNREHMYGYEDDFERFSYFSRAALEYLLKLRKHPDIIHLHDWQTASAAPLFWDIYANLGLGDARIMLTCHNFKYQSTQPSGNLALVGLDPFALNRPDRFQDNQDPSKVNILKGGIVYSNKVTTVSPLYASDLMEGVHAHGLESTLASHRHKFVGLPSTFDEDQWNPGRDAALPMAISAEDPSGKAASKAELRQQLGLPRIDASGVDRPLVGCIAPQVSEADIDMIREALQSSLQCEAQFVFVGASKFPRVQVELEDLKREEKDEHAATVIQYTDALAHLLLAASDVLVCPAVHDPSEEMPLLGLRYGAIPVARQQGGTMDSIVDVDNPTQPRSKVNGFPFYSVEPKDMCAALQRALECYNQDPEGWAALVVNAMSTDTSWDARCCDAYVEAYWSIRNG